MNPETKELVIMGSLVLLVVFLMVNLIMASAYFWYEVAR